MNVLDSPLEALAFNYLSFGSLTLLNNLWTWLALITAALSFWKIRSVNCPKPVPNPHTHTPDPLPDVLTLAPDAVTVTATVTEAPTIGNRFVEDDFDAVTKGKFTAYYEEDEAQCRCGEEEEEQTVKVAKEETESESEWWETWERLLRFRNGENPKGWYTCQHLTDLNGNVVRLWDGGLRFGGSGNGSSDTIMTSEAWYSSSSCIHVW